MRKHTLMLAIVSLIMVFAIACGTTVEIPNNTVAKKSTSAGLDTGIISPGQVRLPGMCLICDNIITAEVADRSFTEEIIIFNTKDKLLLNVAFSGTYSVKTDSASINQIYNRVSAQDTDSKRVRAIVMEDIYSTWGKNIAVETLRSILSDPDKSIEDLMAQQDALPDRVMQKMRQSFEGTPLTIVQASFPRLQPPLVITDAQENARKREEDLNAELAQKAIDIVKAEAAFEVAGKQQLVDFLEAETQVGVNTRLADSVSEPFIIQRYLAFLNKAAESDNMVFIPIETLNSDAAQFRFFNSDLFSSDPSETITNNTTIIHEAPLETTDDSEQEPSTE